MGIEEKHHATKPKRLRSGDRVAQRFVIDRPIGQGGTAELYAAFDTKRSRDVTLKIVRNLIAESGERLIDEARAAASLDHPNIIKVYHVNETEDGRPFLALERLYGMDLGEKLTRDGVFSPKDACHWMLQALEGIAAAHALGFVHRDLKPGNLFLAETTSDKGTKETTLKVLDFGMAKVRQSLDLTPLTKTGTIFGSPAYMSPEQFRSTKDVDHLSDIWSIGITLYELLTGKNPFSRSTPALFLRAILSEKYEPVDAANPTLAVFAPVFDRCFQKTPADRYASVLGIAMDLERISGATGHSERIRRTLPKSMLTKDHRTDAPAFGQETSTRAFEGPTKKYVRKTPQPPEHPIAKPEEPVVPTPTPGVSHTSPRNGITPSEHRAKLLPQTQDPFRDLLSRRNIMLAVGSALIAGGLAFLFFSRLL